MIKPIILKPLNKILPKRFKLWIYEDWEDTWSDLCSAIYYEAHPIKPIVSQEVKDRCILTNKCWKDKTYQKYRYARMKCWILRHESLTCRGLGGIKHCINCHINF